MVHTDSAWCSWMIHSIRHILLIMMINWLTIFSENRSVMRLWFCNDRHVSFLFHISLIFCGLICSVIVVLHIGKFIWSVALLYFVRTERVMNIFIVLRNERKVFRICQFHERSDKTEKCTECVNREVNGNSKINSVKYWCLCFCLKYIPREQQLLFELAIKKFTWNWQDCELYLFPFVSLSLLTADKFQI
jgi:hypothetical protein